MSTHRPIERHIFFPWERRGGILRRLGLHRASPFLLVVSLVGIVTLVGVRERESAGVRRTRAILLRTRAAIDAYLADHDGRCPERFAELADYSGIKGHPRDAWGRPLTLICPGRTKLDRYHLMSDGPDGEPGGLDRIE